MYDTTVNQTREAATHRGDAGAESGADCDEVWLRLRRDPNDPEAKDQLVNRYLPLVKAEAQRLYYHLPSHVDRQELYAEGSIGLLSAISHYDPSQGVRFVAYARKRIWGAMMDRVRSLTSVPRSSIKASRRISRAINLFLNEHGRQPDESELATSLELSVDELHQLERKASHAQLLSLDVRNDSNGQDEGATLLHQMSSNDAEADDPMKQLIASETKGHLVTGLKQLPERERAILVLYYYKGIMLKEIAEAMGVTESRVSQLHSQALARLRTHLRRATNGHPLPVAAHGEGADDAESGG